ncbi:recombination protein RecR [Aestuariivirga litoralis]|uniref:Recombination protein RecR n=1 Tax=Aestuariivirga litoralis TaxID=2650924 RepID=A0A2W2BSW8_9HYPH|nr:recombination mediator RecR [Aestuariivirga litoralis]PZF76536.1 recombination protein RecR [Aestuariivirga litoralis]
MSRRTTGPEIERLIQLLAKLPGLGPRSARRAALFLIKNRERLLAPMALAMAEAQEKVTICTACGNVDTVDPCTLCTDARRDRTTICVVEEVGDLWALERAGAWGGLYHVLGGTLSAIEGVRPEDLSIGALIERAGAGEVKEVVLALNATVEGQTTAHYITERLKTLGIAASRLAHGVPVGGELDYLDEGTLTQAIRARRPL